MASSGELTKCMADATGIPVSSVALCVRSLRESGLIESGAHGVNARRITYVETARLLIALLVTEKPSRASQAVQDFGPLQVSWFSGDKKVDGSDEVPRLWIESGILEVATFEDAVATAIKVFAEKQDSKEFEQAKIYHGGTPLYLPQMEIGVQPSYFSAFIRMKRDWLIRFDHAYRVAETKAEGAGNAFPLTSKERGEYLEFAQARKRYEKLIKSEIWIDQDVVDEIASTMSPDT